MNLKTVFYVALTAYGVGSAIKNYREINAREEKKREEIDANMHRELRAIHVSQGRVIERIDKGEYDNRGLAAMLNDLHFERIVEMEKE